MADIRCPKCGRKTVILTAKKDDRQYHVCINRPRCKGRVPVDEEREDGWGGDWGEEKSAIRTAHDRPRQQVAPYPPNRGAKTTPRTAKKDERKVRSGAKPPERKGRVSFAGDWGDDWDAEILAAKPAPYRPQYPRAQKRAASPEEKEPSKPRQQIVPKKEVAPGKKAPSKPRPQIAPKKKVSLKEKKPSRPWWRRAPKKEAAPEKKGPSKPRQQIIQKKEIASEKKEPPEPQQPIVPKADAVPEVKAPPRPRQRRVPQEYLVPDKKKKRSNVVIIIALVVAFLAIDGMIIVAFVLR